MSSLAQTREPQPPHEIAMWLTVANPTARYALSPKRDLIAAWSDRVNDWVVTYALGLDGAWHHVRALTRDLLGVGVEWVEL